MDNFEPHLLERIRVEKGAHLPYSVCRLFSADDRAGRVHEIHAHDKNPFRAKVVPGRCSQSTFLHGQSLFDGGE